MTLRAFAGVILCSLAACGSSVDSRFDRMCSEIAANLADPAQGACKYRADVPADLKRQLVDTYEELKEARARVQATEEEGRRKGYLSNSQE
jgi:hypothetical protein